jgi:hypothetical protein
LKSLNHLSASSRVLNPRYSAPEKHLSALISYNLPNSHRALVKTLF